MTYGDVGYRTFCESSTHQPDCHVSFYYGRHVYSGKYIVLLFTCTHCNENGQCYTYSMRKSQRQCNLSSPRWSSPDSLGLPASNSLRTRQWLVRRLTITSKPATKTTSGECKYSKVDTVALPVHRHNFTSIDLCA